MQASVRECGLSAPALMATATAVAAVVSGFAALAVATGPGRIAHLEPAYHPPCPSSPGDVAGWCL